MSEIFDDVNSHNLKKLARNSNNGRTVTKTVTLTPTLTALPFKKCRCVELINNANALFFTSHGGDEIECVDPSATPVYCRNANEIKVKGTGELSYLVIE